ncbi:MAG: translocation/assembly module TamB domain-containing protein [Candidatus Aegiribacteria sp.]|nr:translocation/assembly module TamB domain-containing protein [Candidatus Aegiribacteria sp.]
MTRKRRITRWIRMIVLGVIFFLLSIYIFLATGFLGDVPGKIIGNFVSDDSVTIAFRGLHTDIFWSTSADTVIVTDIEGLVVTAASIQIDGNLLNYLVNGRVDQIVVDNLSIQLAPEQALPDDQPTPLLTILNNIDAGVAASTDRLYLRYGIITESGGIIVDSMHIKTSIERNSGVVLNVDSAGIYLPGFGSIRGYGLLRMDDGIVTADEFTGIAAPGSLSVSGTLSGPEETLDIELFGMVGTSSFDLPVDLTVHLEGKVNGKLPDLQAELALSSGKAILFGTEASFEVDSLEADLQNISIRNLSLVTDDAELNFDGAFNIESLGWNASLYLNMTNTDISEYMAQFSATGITGSVHAECRGTGYSGLSGSVTVNLAESSSEMIDLSRLHIGAVLSDNSFSLDGSLGSSSGNATFAGSGYLGQGWVPESWTVQADGEVRDLTFFREFCLSGCPEISSAYFSLSGSGSGFGMNLQGSAGVRELEMQGISAERVSFDGSINYSTRNIIAGDPFGLSFDGSIEALGFSAEGVSADTASLEGTFSIAGSSVTADASLLIDSLRVISDVFHTTADIKLDENGIRIDGLTLAASHDRLYTAEIEVGTGDTTSFSVEEIRATHSKLRVITSGGLSGFTENGTIILDTLWLDPPVGDLAMSGILSPEGLEIKADIVNIDLSSFSTFSGLPADMSGVGNFRISYLSDSTGVHGSLTGQISDPVYGQFRMDSITVDISAENSAFNVNGIYAWHNGVRSGLQMKARDVWAGTDAALLFDKIQWLELEINNIGDWLFYVLPSPVKTMGASVSARVEYERFNGDYTLEIQASARINRLYITMLGIELPNVNFYMNYPDTTQRGYNARLTLGSGSENTGNFSSSWRADIVSLIPFELGDYSLTSTLSDMEVAIPGMGAVICSGGLSSSGTGVEERPVLSGQIKILEGAVGIPQSVSSSSSSGSGELPFDLSIDVTGTGDLWFRTNFADIEMALKLRIFTLERKPTVNGYVSAVRGRITLLQRDFQITEGRVNIIQGNPPVMQLNVTAETKVRSVISHEEYLITIHISGDLDNLDISLTCQGPSGQLPQEDILTLLAVGLTYSEMQQMNSSSIRSEVENVAQTMLGSLLARNLRHEIGLDTFEISPELLSDTTSLILNVGKYVLPNLYVSYKDDVFSADPGTVSAQYLFSPDFYVEGTSRTTIHGYLEPTVELHYTIRY